MSTKHNKIIKTVRLNEDECNKINEWLENNNPSLENIGEEPLMLSEVVHLLVQIGLPRLSIKKSGEAVFE